MKLFNARIDATGEELCVVARTMNHAADVVVTFWVARTMEAPGAFSIGRGAPAEYRDDISVKITKAGNVSGVIVRQENGSMLFEPMMGG